MAVLGFVGLGIPAHGASARSSARARVQNRAVLRPSTSRRGPSRPARLPHMSVKDSSSVELDWNNLEFVLVDPKTNKKKNLTLADKESMFLDALHSFFVGKPLLSNDEFDLLKSDLTWEGSPVATLNREELEFLEAARAYAAGKPTMSDDDYNALKKKLRKEGSPVAVSKGPQCSMVTQTCWSDCVEERGREFVLFLPAAGIVAILWSIVSFELTPLRFINPLVSLGVGSPFIYYSARFLTGLVLPEPRVIMSGECPNCGAVNRVYFGDVATLKGYHDTADINCQRCDSELRFIQDRRQLELVTTQNNSSPKVAVTSK